MFTNIGRQALMGFRRQAVRRNNVQPLLRYFTSKSEDPTRKMLEHAAEQRKLATDEFFHQHETVTVNHPGTDHKISYAHDESSAIHGDTLKFRTQNTTTVHDHGTVVKKTESTTVHKPVEAIDDDSLTKLFSTDQLKFYRTLQEECDKVPVLKLPEETIKGYVQKCYGEGAPKKQRVFHLVVGPPGSGKSSVVVDALQDQYGAMIVDSDHIKPHLPSYNKGYGGNAVHGMSSKIATRLLVKAMHNGDNIVHPTTGYCPNYIMDLITAAKEQGYKVGLHLVDLPKEEAAKRVFHRCTIPTKEGGRQIVNLVYTMHVVGDKPKAAYEKVLSQAKHLLDEHSHWDNNVPHGTRPKLVDRSEKTIADQLREEEAARETRN